MSEQPTPIHIQLQLENKNDEIKFLNERIKELESKRFYKSCLEEIADMRIENDKYCSAMGVAKHFVEIMRDWTEGETFVFSDELDAALKALSSAQPKEPSDG